MFLIKVFNLGKLRVKFGYRRNYLFCFYYFFKMSVNLFRVCIIVNIILYVFVVFYSLRNTKIKKFIKVLCVLVRI